MGGTWCPPCGAYGKPTKESLKAQFGDKLTLISCQVNGSVADPMNNADANAFLQLFQAKGVPIIYVGGNNGVIQGIGGSTTMSATATTRGNELKALEAAATCSASLSLSGDDLTINTETKFFQDQTEEYYLAAYITENGLSYTQASDASANKNIHDYVLRAKASSAITGDLVSSNNKKGDVKAKKFTTTLNNSWNKSKLNVSLILWRKNTNGQLTICNGFTKKLM